MEKISVSFTLTDEMKAYLKDFNSTSIPLTVENNLIRNLSNELVKKFKDNIVAEYKPDLQQTTYHLKIGVQPLGFPLPIPTWGGDYFHKEVELFPPKWADPAEWVDNPADYGITCKIKTGDDDTAAKIKALTLHPFPDDNPVHPYAPDEGWIPPPPKKKELVTEEVNKELGEIWRVLVKHGMGWEDRKEIFDRIKKLCAPQGEK